MNHSKARAGNPTLPQAIDLLGLQGCELGLTAVYECGWD